MMEMALVLGIALLAACGLIRSFRRRLTDANRTGSCGDGCSCLSPSCSGNGVSGNRDGFHSRSEGAMQD